jgi:hypothetical protein
MIPIKMDALVQGFAQDAAKATEQLAYFPHVRTTEADV